jgi:transposase
MPRPKKYPDALMDRGVLNAEEREEIRKLRREAHDPRRANEILKSVSVCFAKELDQDRTR